MELELFTNKALSPYFSCIDKEIRHSMLHQSVVASFREKESRIGIAQEGTDWKVNYFLVEFLV